MKPWLWMTLCLGCLALAGCRANSHRAMLEQESRQWEDRYYVVKDRLDQCQSELCSVRERNHELEESSDHVGSSGSRDSTIPGQAPLNNKGMSSDRLQKIQSGLPPLRTPESIKPDGHVDPESVAPPFVPGAPKPPTIPSDGVAPGSEAPRFTPPGSGKPRNQLQNPILPRETKLPLPGDNPPPMPDTKKGSNLSGDSSEVARIELIGMPTDGFDSDGRPGDDGVRFVLQPRDSNGRTVDAAGPISVVVVDPLPEGKSVRLARWDLTPDQAAGYHQRSPSGFHLRLPWTAKEPKHSRLRLFARYTTADGRKVQAEKAITVATAGQKPSNWSIEPQPELSQSAATQTSPTKPSATMATKPSPKEVSRAKPQPAQPRIAAQPRQAQQQQAPPKRKRPVWSPDRP